MSDERQAWDRRDGEPARAHAALTDYLRMGDGRSLAKLAGVYADQAERSRADAEAVLALPPTRRLTTLKDWSVRWDWQARAAAWDAVQDQAEGALWEQRRREIREQDFDNGSALRALVEQGLREGQNFVRRKRTVVQAGRPAVMDAKGNVIDPGEPAREVITLGFDMAALVRAVEAASKLQRMAAGMPESHAELSGHVVEMTAADLPALLDQVEDWAREQRSGVDLDRYLNAGGPPAGP